MILVDTSVWIDFFSKSSKIKIPVELIPNLAVCPPVIQEVLQGIRDDNVSGRVQQSLLSFNISAAFVDLEHHLEAVAIYRSGRRRGITIRSSVDCLIAAIALREKNQIWHRDRDFHEIAKFTELKIFNGI